MKHKIKPIALKNFGWIILILSSSGVKVQKDVDWSEYLGRTERKNYSSVIQIDSGNVTRLKIAWKFHTGDSGEMQQNLISDFLFRHNKTEIGDKIQDDLPTLVVPHKFNGYKKVLYEYGLPSITPPWSTLTANNLNTGRHIWRLPSGEIDSLSQIGNPLTGTENYGGPLATAGGILLIAATKDRKLTVFNSNNGRLLRELLLPESGFALPVTYAIKGRQYVVIASDEIKLGTPKGDSYIALALPDK